MATKIKQYTEKCIPISWVDWGMISTFHIQWIEVTFTADFGPIKSGTFYPVLNFSLGTGKLTAWAGQNEQILQIDLKLIPTA